MKSDNQVRSGTQQVNNSPVSARCYMEIADAQVLHMEEILEVCLRIPEGGIRESVVRVRIDAAHLEWKQVIRDLTETRDDSSAWLTNVELVYVAFCSQISSGL